jgi:hypothetical protein
MLLFIKPPPDGRPLKKCRFNATINGNQSQVHSQHDAENSKDRRRNGSGNPKRVVKMMTTPETEALRQALEPKSVKMQLLEQMMSWKKSSLSFCGELRFAWGFGAKSPSSLIPKVHKRALFD